MTNSLPCGEIIYCHPKNLLCNVLERSCNVETCDPERSCRAPLVLLAALRHCLATATIVLLDFSHLLTIAVRSRRALAAENLFLRKQLALFQERKVKPRRAGDSTRWMMATLSHMFALRDALWNVKPETLIGWHRQGFRLFWRWKSKPSGRPRLPKDIRHLIREMAADNTTWGEERIANELKLKLGI
jgi:putative transposase